VLPPVELIVLDAALRYYGTAVQSVAILQLSYDDESTMIRAAVRLRPRSEYVTVQIVAT
jgi:membrane protease subunit (stomatin/prohibitin family)